MTGFRVRHSAIVLLAAATAPAFALAPATPLTAERAIEIQTDSVRETLGTLPCRRDGAGGDIVVCGRSGPDPNRIPFPDQLVPGDRENLLPGELPRAQASYDTCMIGCPQPVSVDLFWAAKTGAKIVRHILGKDD